MADQDNQTQNSPGNDDCAKSASEGLSVPEDVLLTSLERPGFFSGQLLTDKDLTSLTRWTRSRLSLARLRDGWGIAHGLDLTADPEKPGQLLVSQGYAIDANGNDIVVERVVEFNPVAAAGAEPAGDGSVFDIDVWIEYAEHKTDPEPALARSSCSKAKECAYTRIDETFIIGAAVSGADASTERQDAEGVSYEEWARDFKGCVGVALHYEDRFGSSETPPPGTKAADWLKAFAAERPLTVRPETLARIQALADAPRATSAVVIPILYAMIQDYRLTYADSNEDKGALRIPLARVRLVQLDGNGSTAHAVQAIDAMAPFRRTLARTPMPAPAGRVNVAPLIGRRLDDGDQWLSDHGLSQAWCEPLNLAEIAKPGELGQKLEFSPFISLLTHPVIVFDTDEHGIDRVAAVYGAADTRLRNATVTRHAEPDPVMPGDDVVLSYKVTNTGRTRLDLTVSDSLLPGGEDIPDIRGLAPGESKDVTTVFIIPDTSGGHDPEARERDGQGNRIVTSIVTVRETGGDGTVLDTCEAHLVLLQPLGLHIELEAAYNHNAVRADEMRTYHLIAANGGQEDLRVVTRITATGMGDRAEVDKFDLPVGETIRRTYEFRVVDDDNGRFTVKADTVGRAVGNRQVIATAYYTVTVVRSYTRIWSMVWAALLVLYLCLLGWPFGLAPRKVDIFK